MLSQIENSNSRLEVKKHLGNTDKWDTFYLSDLDNMDTGNDVKVLPVAHILDLIMIFGNVTNYSVAHKLGDSTAFFTSSIQCAILS